MTKKVHLVKNWDYPDLLRQAPEFDAVVEARSYPHTPKSQLIRHLVLSPQGWRVVRKIMRVVWASK